VRIADFGSGFRRVGWNAKFEIPDLKFEIPDLKFEI
jgi:hypothetical protein